MGSIKKAFDLTGKSALITGGSRGLGLQIAEALGEQGASIILSSRKAPDLEQAQKHLAGLGIKADWIAADNSREDDVKRLADEAITKLGKVDILVNNAGATRGGNFFELPDEAFIDGFALKYFAAVRLSRLFWPLLKAAHGSIINIIGAAARTPGPDFLIGGSVNAAFANFAKGLATLGNRDDVNVNVIHPGMVETDRVVTLFQQFAKAQNKTPEQVREDILKRTGTRRIGVPQDVAEDVDEALP